MIPPDDWPHAPTWECGCGPFPATAFGPRGGRYAVAYHLANPAWDPADHTPDMGATVSDEPDQRT